MNFFTIARYRILQYLRDKQSLISMLLIPIILILILGNALKNSSDFSARKIDKINVIYLNRGEGKNRDNFNNFIKADYLNNIINPTEISNFDEGKDLILKRKYDAFIIYDENITGKLQVVGSDYNALGVSIVQNIADSYASTGNTFEALQKIKARDFNFSKTSNISDNPVAVSGKKPAAVDYYSITMLVMIILFGSIYANFAIDIDYYSVVGGRMKTAPVKLWEIFVGEGIGSLFTLMWQAIILLLVSRFAFNVNFGDSIFVLLLTVFSLAIMSTMLGILACMATKKGMSGLIFLNILVPILTFLGGGFVKVNFTGFLGTLSRLTPNYLAQNAIFKNIYGGSTSEIYLSILGLWIFTFIFFIGAKIVGRRDII
ncbi:ABC-2 type transport system permease protein [Clostridium cavendishii DSM 21758]|uniref:ABC-2 type transport system permease protein n=1 Tax=Clostridium cavendishii DSM 21758 TaxID=1121302 RepID=A0A1M6H0Q0_9CLOT|nr:ABC transporter permease [Clostridium cavendishii]SHJ15779.1 ABC-2 type transport system permease protein [Clostridium cavendishii DSM 21758]